MKERFFSGLRLQLTFRNELSHLTNGVAEFVVPFSHAKVISINFPKVSDGLVTTENNFRIGPSFWKETDVKILGLSCSKVLTLISRKSVGFRSSYH